MARRPSDVPEPILPPDQSVRGRPDVILEFLFDCGLLHIAVRNLGDRPALGVSVKFNRKFTGAEGRSRVSDLLLFKNIEFLGPGREIKTFLDSSYSYFRRKQPTSISARVTYRDSTDRKYESTINHDLEIYRDLLYLADNEQHCRNTPDQKQEA